MSREVLPTLNGAHGYFYIQFLTHMPQADTCIEMFTRASLENDFSTWKCHLDSNLSYHPTML